MTRWVSKPCWVCECPKWEHGGVSGCDGGCFWNPECTGCSGYVPYEDGEDITCSKERQDELIAIGKKIREIWLKDG